MRRPGSLGQPRTAVPQQRCRAQYSMTKTGHRKCTTSTQKAWPYVWHVTTGAWQATLCGRNAGKCRINLPKEITCAVACTHLQLNLGGAQRHTRLLRVDGLPRARLSQPYPVIRRRQQQRRRCQHRSRTRREACGSVTGTSEFILLLLLYYILGNSGQPPEAHWSCRQSVSAHLRITIFACFHKGSKVGLVQPRSCSHAWSGLANLGTPFITHLGQHYEVSPTRAGRHGLHVDKPRSFLCSQTARNVCMAAALAECAIPDSVSPFWVQNGIK